jgi:hypothetical protein
MRPQVSPGNVRTVGVAIGAAPRHPKANRHLCVLWSAALASRAPRGEAFNISQRLRRSGFGHVDCNTADEAQHRSN